MDGGDSGGRNMPLPGPAAGLSLAVRNAQLDAHNAKMLAQFEREVAPPSVSTAGATAGGDERKLRGIPAIGRGVSGAVAGSSPHLVVEYLGSTRAA